MSHRRATLFASVLFALAAPVLVAGCGGGKDSEGPVLAEIGERTVTADYYKSRLVRMQENQLPRDEDGQPYDMSTLEGKRAFLDVIVDKELMVSKALQLGYDDDTQVDAALEHLIGYFALNYHWEDRIGDPSRFVAEADLDYYYSRLGERRECDFLITDLRDQVDQARAEVLAGAPWSEVVAKYHSGPLRENNPPRLTISWGQYRDDFEQPIFAVAAGEVTEPILTEHGWWLVRVNEVVMEEKPDLEAIRGKVIASIAKRNENLRREEIRKEITDEHHLVINEDALKVVYDGLPAEENIIDPETQEPVPQDQLQDLEVPTESYDTVLLSYDLMSGPYISTIADYKASFDRQNVFERPKKAEMLGGLRAKLKAAAEKAILVDHARKLGYFEDERARKAAYRKIEEMLVDKVHKEVVSYEEQVSPEELEAFWAEHGHEYAKPERRDGHVVRCADLGTAQTARAQIVAGEMTWKQVNRTFGNDPELEQTFGRIVRVPADAAGPVRPVLFSLEVGEISEPFETPGGWVVVQLDQIHAPEQPTMVESAEIVGQRIRNNRMDQALRDLLAEWREEFGVTIYEDRLAEMPSWQDAIREAAEAKNQAAVDAAS